MSFNNKNLFALLGNDVTEEEPFVAPKEIVAPQKSHKKDGVPPKANEAKSKGGKPRATGNEAGAKYQNKNKDQSAPNSTQRKSGKDKKFDRHSRTGRVDTAKAAHQRLGDEAESQLEGEVDAAEEAADEASEEDAQPKVQLTSAADYFKELAAKKAVKETVEVEINPEDLIKKEVEVLFEGTASKKNKAPKAKKEKKYLELDFTFDAPAAEQRSQRDYKPRTGKKPFTGKKPAAKQSAAKPASKLTEKNFPSLN